jgi:hypothetical protein
MAESLLQTGKGLIFSASSKPGGEFSFSISTDSVEVALQVVKEVCKAATTLGALYVGYKLLRPVIEGAVKKALGGERDDQEVRDIKPGSLHVLLSCVTDERYLEVLADHESGRMKERFQEEFSKVGIEVEGLKVEIENMAEVNERTEAVNKRYHDRLILKTTYCIVVLLWLI